MVESNSKLRKLMFLLFYVALTHSEAPHEDNENTNIRLPSNICPRHYTLKLKPYLENKFETEGYVEIVFKVHNATSEIILHMRDILTHNESLQVSPVDASSLMKIRNQTYDVEREFYIVKLNENLLDGREYILKLNFTGSLSSDLEGFFRASYTEGDGVKRLYAATHFQATHTRKAFPCFDEPHLKATFKIFLERRENMTAVSNMPLQSSKQIEPGWIMDEFETMVPMSTYLLAFVISDLKHVEVKNDRLTTKLKLWARESKIGQAEFGRQFSGKALVYLEEYFNLSFPLPKLDFVSLTQLSPNGMENWGLILVRETGLLFNPEKGSDAQKRWIAYLIAHELAHQWFGNIVTMKWWTDLWLNEGFATYIGHAVVDQILPEMKMLQRFVVGSLQSVMQLDALKSAPPVRIPVEHPAQIKEVFGDIAYSKGASIIRMMRYFLGEETFRQALTSYLNDLKYKSSEQDDLWYHLTKAAHANAALRTDLRVKDIMETWTSQSGFPVISVSRDENSITFEQKPFVLNFKHSNESDDTRRWFVPITMVTQDRPEFKSEFYSDIFWLRKEATRLTIRKNIPELDKWILLNYKQTGYYRVNYDHQNWHLLAKQLLKDHTAINVVNRAQILDDALNLAKAGLLDYFTALSVTAYLKNESEYLPWQAAQKNVDYLDTMLRTTRVYGAFKSYILSTISEMFESLGLSERETDSETDKALRKDIVTTACYFGHHGCVSEAVNQINSWRNSSSKVSPVNRNLAHSFYCVAIREGNEDIWDFMWSRFQDPNEDPGHKGIIRGALGCSRELWILARYLESAFKPDHGISLQEAPSVYAAVASTPIGSFFAWNHLKENWIAVRDYIGSSMFALPSLVKTVTSHLSTVQQRDEMALFKKKYEGEFGSAKWSVNQALEKTEANVAWKEANLEGIELWLRAKGFTSSLKQP